MLPQRPLSIAAFGDASPVPVASAASDANATSGSGNAERQAGPASGRGPGANVTWLTKPMFLGSAEALANQARLKLRSDASVGKARTAVLLSHFWRMKTRLQGQHGR